ncbi:MAG TPA: acyl-CoA dehydratase activase [Candidatus Limnocylindrales bacterium]|nr:acyl-CoA dehydratase activase [Candidatus Limnocylindrales bacterium]
MAQLTENTASIGLDIGIFAVKGVLVEGDRIQHVYRLIAGNPALASKECFEILLKNVESSSVRLGLTGSNARMVAEEIGISPILEIEALQAGLAFRSIKAETVLSLGHESMYYLELESSGAVSFFNRNGQCAAGSGSFWYQQATRMGYNAQELAEVAVQSGSSVKISGRCAVFAKSDMTHAINEGASQAAVADGMARALVDLVVTGVANNRINGSGGTLVAIGGVANNKAIFKHLQVFCQGQGVEIVVPPDHEYISALGAALTGVDVELSKLGLEHLLSGIYVPDNPLPPLDPGRVIYDNGSESGIEYDLSTLYLGVDCGSVSTKCALADSSGRFIGGVYLPTAGRPALQVLALMNELEQQYGHFLAKGRIVACTTGSGRFLAQKILNAEYAVDEITCQAEGVKSLYDDETLSIIEIGGEDSKFVQIKNGVLFDYNMNPVCAAGTGTFLENLAELLGVKIEEEFSQKAFQADYAVDLGDTCTLLSQSTLVSAASRGLPLQSQLASLAYSSARNYLNRTVENRTLEGKLIFTGATAKNHALASAFAFQCDKKIYVPQRPELTGALGAALAARLFHLDGVQAVNSFHKLDRFNSFTLEKRGCRATCQHEHNCQLDVIKFTDGTSFIYGDRCGRYSNLENKMMGSELPDHLLAKHDKFWDAAGEPLFEGIRVGIACGGLFYELYPFWAAFFKTLGASLVLSGESSEEILEQGKSALDTEMCYPIEVLIGHYRELMKKDLDYIFIPEVIDLEPLPWAVPWGTSSSCPLLQMVRGVVVHSLKLPEDKVLHAQLFYREGPARIREQMQPLTRKLLGKDYSHERLNEAVGEGYRALENYRRSIEEEGQRVIEGLKAHPEAVVAVILGRSYTLYDSFVSKNLMVHAAKRGLVALPQDFLLEYMRGWYEGRINSSFLDPHREEFERYMKDKMKHMDNIYPAQLQQMLSTALVTQFLNDRVEGSGLPQMHLVLQDPFRCGPNSMLRHYLDNVSGYLRLTLDEHTAAAGMITRLEAFKNTCRSRKKSVVVPFYSARPAKIADHEWNKILIPDGTKHSSIFAALFESRGIESAPLPRSNDKDLTLARHYLNGEECLPFIQNMQDYLEYAVQNPLELAENGVVFFQGWSCGPCRYGLYAPTQALLLNRAGYGAQKVCAIKMEDLVKRFGPAFVVAFFDGTVAVDQLYKMLHSSRPYELEKGASEALFEDCCEQLCSVLRSHRFSWPQLLPGSHLKPLEKLLAESAKRFAAIPRNGELRPRIMVAGEFYVRLDDRCNQDLIKQIEVAGGEAAFAPASEFFSYTAYTNYRKAEMEYSFQRSIANYAKKLGYAAVARLAQRDEHRLAHAAVSYLHGQEEPEAWEIRKHSIKYVPERSAGEPPMTIGRTIAFSSRDRVAGAIFVAPFTCMPAAVVEAQQGVISEDLGIPIITIYYDGRDNTNRDEFIQSLVFQARQKLAQKMSQGTK